MQEAPVLKPLSVGDIIDRMLRLFRAEPLLFIGIAIFPTLITEVLQRAVGLSQSFDLNEFTQSLSTPGARPAFPVRSIDPVLASVIGIVSVVLSATQAAAITHAVGRRYLGRAETVGDAYRNGVRAMPRLILSVVVVIVVFVVAVTAIALAIVASAAALAALAAVGVILGLVAFFFGLPWAFASLALVGPAIVLEDLGPIAAIRRSFQLVDRARLRTLGLWLLMGIITSLLALIFSLLFLASIVAEPTMRSILQAAATVASSSISSPLLFGALVILYYDLRVRKEAFDLQLAAEALPREG